MTSEKNISILPKNIAELEKESKANILEYLCVLVDHSGSMYSRFESGGRKSDAAQKAFDTLWNATDWSICEMKTFAFDDFAKELTCSDSIKPVLPQPNGGTNFSTALRAGLANSETTRIILCSDGETAYPSSEIQTCIERGIPVDTIYIKSSYSPNHETAEELLRRISEETGGQFCTVDNAEALTQAFAQLETHERLLLGYSGEEEVIKL